MRTPNGPDVNATVVYSEPPHRPFQPSRRHLRCKHKTKSSRPPLTSSSTHFRWLLQRQPPRLHAQRRKDTFYRDDHRGHLLRPTLVDYDILTAGHAQRFYRRPRSSRHHRLEPGTCNTPNQPHPFRFIGPSGANGASTASSATDMQSPCAGTSKRIPSRPPIASHQTLLSTSP